MPMSASADMDKYAGASVVLPFHEYMSLWTSMTKESASGMAELCSRVFINCEKKNAEKEKALQPGVKALQVALYGEVSKNADEAKAAAALLKTAAASTLAYLVLAKPVCGTDAQLAAGIKYWEKMRTSGAGAGAERGFVDTIISSCNGETLSSENIEMLTEAAVRVLSTRGSECPLPPAQELGDGLGVARAVLLPFLTDVYTREGAGPHTQMLLDALVMTLKSQPSEHTVMAVLYLLRYFCTVRPVREPAMLAKLSMAVQPFYLWALPHGLAAKDTLQFLATEARCPGAARMLRAKGDIDDGRPGFDLSSEALPPLRPLHVLIDSAARNAGWFEAVVNAHPKPDPVGQWLDQVIMYLLGGAAQADVDALAAAADAVRGSRPSAATVGPLLRRCEAAMAEALDPEQAEEDARAALAEAFAPVVADVIALKDAATAGATPPVRLLPRFERLREDGAGQGRSLDEATSWLPFGSIQVFHIDADDGVRGGGGEGAGAGAGSAGGMGRGVLGAAKYISSAAQDHLAVWLSRYAGAASPAGSGKERGLARIVLGGGNGSVHSFVTAYVALRQTQPELFANVDVDVYIVPLGERCSLASYLATYDGIYARTVFAPFHSACPLLPHMSREGVSEAVASAAGAQVPSTPVGILQHSLRNYVVGAEQRLHVNVYEMECWSAAPGSADGELTLQYTVPFCERAEVGFYSGLKDVRSKRMSYYEMPHDKPAKLPALDLRVTFTMMNILGVPRQKSCTETKPVYVLVLSNVPRVGERATLANPAAEWLEMFTLDTDPLLAKKKKSKLFGELDYSRTYHVGHVEIEAANRLQPFEVLIDGELHGPFVKLVVTPSKVPGSNESITLPVRHFLPLDL